MHSIQEILAETRKTSNLCCAVEKGGIVCFKKKATHDKYCSMHRGRLHKYKSLELPIKEKKRCKFIDCNRKYERGGYCGLHYSNIWGAKKRNFPKSDLEKCLVEDCNNKNYVRGYCNKHYLKLIRYNDPNYKKKMNNGKKHTNVLGRGKNKKCIAPGCCITNEIPNSILRGLCRKHYNRWRKFGDYNIVSKKEYEEKLKNN
jgi:hypothetical protein